MRIQNLIYRTVAACIAVVIITLLPSCTGQDGRMVRVLDTADSLMAERPDSALTLLEALLPDTAVMGKPTLMRYHLLRTNARNKCDTVLGAADLAHIQLATEHYDKDGTSNERMLAHYLAGRCYADMGEAPAALEEYNRAVNSSDTSSEHCDYYLLGLVHSQSGNIYNKLYMPANELRELQSASKCALLANDSLTYLFYEELACNCYLRLHMTDSFLERKEKCAVAFHNMGYENYSSIAYGSMASTCLENGDLENAKKYLSLYERFSGFFDAEGNIERGRETYYYCKGLMYLYCGRTDSAEMCFRKELRLGSAQNDRLCAMQGLCKLYTRQHNSDSVAKYATMSYNLSDSIYEQELRVNLQRMESLHDYTRHKEKAFELSQGLLLAKMKYRILEISAVLLLAIIGFLFRWYRNRMARREAKKNRLLLDYLKDNDILKKKEEELQNIIDVERHIRKQLESEVDGHVSQFEDLKREKNRLNEELSHRQETINSLRLLINDKKKEIGDILTKQRQAEAVVDHVASDLSQIVEIKKSSVFAVFDSYAKNRKGKPAQEDWDELQELVETNYPKFVDLLRVKNRVSEYDYHLCVLIVLGFMPGEICSIMEKEPPSISKSRKKLLKNIFHLEGKPDEFDQLLKVSV